MKKPTTMRTSRQGYGFRPDGKRVSDSERPMRFQLEQCGPRLRGSGNRSGAHPTKSDSRHTLGTGCRKASLRGPGGIPGRDATGIPSPSRSISPSSISPSSKSYRSADDRITKGRIISTRIDVVLDSRQSHFQATRTRVACCTITVIPNPTGLT